MQIADSSVVPNVIEFNVTVAAAATPVYDVILSAGSNVFSITGSDSISGPSPVTNNSNFVITGNSLMKWKQALLGMSFVLSKVTVNVLF